jgi:hypothetical protein
LRAALVSYFDMGQSYGITDDRFETGYVNPKPDIGLVGIQNPLGQGCSVSLLESSDELVSQWRQEAARQAFRPEMEIGWSSDFTESRNEFQQRLANLIEDHPVSICELTVYSIGTVFLRLEFGSGVDLRFLHGLLACWEFAAYRPSIADLLRGRALQLVDAAASHAPREFLELTSRPVPKPERDLQGYEEVQILTSFTSIISLVDDGDKTQLEQLLDALKLDLADMKEIDFEHHGMMHYNWATCILTPRGSPEWTYEQELSRPLECIRIAHVAQGACEAFLKLFEAEIKAQVEDYVKEKHSGRTAQDLNRLRTLALAVVNLTNLDRVTPSDEDQEYFHKFASDAGLEDTRRLISEACDMLYNVQDAETQFEQSRRDNVLNAVVALLASLTLISVTADAYNFVRDQESIISGRVERAQLLLEFVIALALLFTLGVWLVRRGGPRRGRER